VRLWRHPGIPHGRHHGRGHLHEKLILIDDQTVIFGSHNLAWSSISSNYELSVCIEDEGLICQAEALFWQRWQLASAPDPNLWELATPLDLPFVP
jgi:phosphatidylserine/phosphatidylglycerophosphate/cardiolipin synthase-like enzyme